MKILLCQPNFDSFLTAVYHSYYFNQNVDIITSKDANITLLDETVLVGHDMQLSQKVQQGIKNRFGCKFFEEVYTAYLSCDLTKEQKIFKYLQLLFKEGKKAKNMFDLPAVVDFNDMLHKVWHECHRMTSFIRLRETEDGYFYGYFASDNDVLEMIAPFFLNRFNTQKFVLHDVKRQKMLLYNGVEHFCLPAPKIVEIEFSQHEKNIEKLWKTYFKHITIESRQNLKAQTQFLPKKYRFFMNEFSVDDK